MSVRIITLCENTALFGFTAEWGLSLLVTRDDYTFLLDTGMTTVAVDNAERHKVDFARIGAIVLSHGHRDHTGGLEHFLKRTGPIDVVAHPDVFTRKFSSRHQPPDDDITIPLSRQEYEQLGARFRLSREPLELAPGIWVSGEVPMRSELERIDQGLLTEVDGQKVDDPLADDISVAIDTPEGLYVLMGCAHRGPVNVIEHFVEVTGQQRVALVAGGLHLTRANRARIDATADYLESRGVKKIASCHCTGFEACAVFAERFGSAFTHANSGRRLFFN